MISSWLLLRDFRTQVKRHFSSFIELYRKNEKEWRPFLTDKGLGDAPVELLIAFEEGLRNYADNVHHLGTRPLRSRKYWALSVDIWRKREPYIALIRFLLGLSPDYQQWDCFLFSDYSLRQICNKTFMIRHLPLSDGNDEANFMGKMNFDWSKRVQDDTPKKVKSEPVVVKTTQSDASASAKRQPMIFDVELGCLVPFDS